ERRAQDADPRRAVQLVRLRRDERLAGLRPQLIQPRSLTLSPSYPLAGAIAGAHLCAAACAALVIPGWAGGALAAALAVLGLASAWGRALLRSRGSARAIELSAGRATVRLTSGESLAAEAAGHVSRLAVTLRLAEGARRTVLVTADML